MIFRPRQKRQILDLPLELNGHKIDQVKEVNKFLGVVLDECMTWKHHISHVASKISKSVGIMYKSSFCLSINQHYVCSFMLSYILICNIVLQFGVQLILLIYIVLS
jgi:hypothetical protein